MLRKNQDFIRSLILFLYLHIFNFVLAINRIHLVHTPSLENQQTSFQLFISFLNTHIHMFITVSIYLHLYIMIHVEIVIVGIWVCISNRDLSHHTDVATQSNSLNQRCKQGFKNEKLGFKPNSDQGHKVKGGILIDNFLDKQCE